MEHFIYLSGVPEYMAEKSGTKSSLVSPAATQEEYKCRLEINVVDYITIAIASTIAITIANAITSAINNTITIAITMALTNAITNAISITVTQASQFRNTCRALTP